MPRNSDAVFLQSLKTKSDRDVTRELKKSREEISAIAQRTHNQTKTVEETSAKLAEAKKLVKELQTELTDAQTSLKNDEKRKKKLTTQADAMEKHLQQKRAASEKDTYVKRCIEYLVENGDDHIDRINCYVTTDLGFLDGAYTEEDLDTLSDDDVIELAHLTRVCEIFDAVKEEGGTSLWEWNCPNRYDSYNDYIYFSERVSCNNNSTSPCCHKRYADTLNWSISEVISYRRPKFGKPFRIDTPVEGSYNRSRVN